LSAAILASVHFDRFHVAAMYPLPKRSRTIRKPGLLRGHARHRVKPTAGLAG
jgi:hypothetical protein